MPETAVPTCTFGGRSWGPWANEHAVGWPAANAVVGGHATISLDYTDLADDDTVRIATWATWKPATWRWVRARLEEAHGLIWRSLAPAIGPWFNAYDRNTLGDPPTA